MKKDIFDDLILPTDEEIKFETQYKKIGLASASRTQNNSTRKKMSDKHKQNYNDPKFYDKRCDINKKSRTNEVKNKISQSLTGLVRGTPSTKHRQKLSQALKGIPKPKYVCPICGKEGAGPIMKRFHFDNCKHK